MFRVYKFEALLMRICLLTKMPTVGVSYNVCFTFVLDFVTIDFIRFFDYGTLHSVSRILPSQSGVRVPFNILTRDDVYAVRCSELRQRRADDLSTLHNSWRELMKWISIFRGVSLTLRGHLVVENDGNNLFDSDCTVGVDRCALLTAVETSRASPAPFIHSWQRVPLPGALVSAQMDAINTIPNFKFRDNHSNGKVPVYAKYQTSSARFHLIYGSDDHVISSFVDVNNLPCVRPLKRRRLVSNHESRNAQGDMFHCD